MTMLQRGELPREFDADITAADINEGVAWDCERCPLALSIIRTLSTDYGVVVLSLSVNKCDAELATVAATPLPIMYWHNAYGFIDDYDHYRPVNPTRVHLTRLQTVAAHERDEGYGS